MGHTIKDTFFKTVGGFILFSGILLAAIALGMTIAPQPGEEKTGPAIFIFSLGIVAPGLFLYLKGRNIAKNEKNAELITSLVTSYRRVSLEQLEKKTGLTRKDVINALTHALSLGLITGYLDRSTDEFFTDRGAASLSPAGPCPSCGAPFEKKFLEGETITCERCGTIIS